MTQLFKVVTAIVAVYLLFYFSIVSLDALVLFSVNLGLSDILTLICITTILILGTYFRWYFCSGLLGFSISKGKMIAVSSEAYTFGQIIPGQLGIDGWRILRFKDLDKSKLKAKLLAVAFIEKMIALFVQVIVFSAIILILFKEEVSYIYVLISIVSIILVCRILFRLSKYFFQKKLQVNIPEKYVWPLGKIFMFSMALTFLACCLMFLISRVMLGEASPPFLTTSAAMLSSNLGSAIPITPNGIGLAEFLYSKVLSIIGDDSRVELHGTSYLIYRVLNVIGHFCIYITVTLVGTIPWRCRVAG